MSANAPRDPRRAHFADCLEALCPATALFDGSRRLLAANAAFRALCAAPEAVPPDGAAPTLDDLLPTLFDGVSSARAGAAGEMEEMAWIAQARAADGRLVRVRARPFQDLCGVTVEPIESAQAPVFHSAIRALEQQRALQKTLMALGHAIALSESEDALVASICRAIRALFPGRNFCIRILHPETGRLATLYAEGKLLDEHREHLFVFQPLLSLAGIDPADVRAEHIAVTDRALTPFASGRPVISALLSTSQKLFGQLDVERLPAPPDGPTPMPAPDVPRPALDPPARSWEESREEQSLRAIAAQTAIGLRNAALIESLTRMKERLEETIEHANAIVLAATADGRIAMFNHLAAQLTGFTREEVLGRDLADLIPEAACGPIREIVQKTLDGENVTNAEAELRTKAGKLLRVALSSSPLPDDHPGIILIGQDLSRLRELERHVTHAEKLASLGKLSASVVHEITSPLMTIKMYAESLLQLAQVRGAPDEEAVKLRRICEATERIARFSRELTTYARPASDQLAPISIEAVIEQASVYCEHVFRRAHLALRREIEPGLPEVMGVRSDLVQVLVNLFTNACHASSDSKEPITVKAKACGDAIEVEICDHGRGIEENLLSDIFLPFFTTKAEGDGTGLGLAIVQRIVQKHAGEIRVASALGEGTTFTLRLPRAKAASGGHP